MGPKHLLMPVICSQNMEMDSTTSHNLVITNYKKKRRGKKPQPNLVVSHKVLPFMER